MKDTGKVKPNDSRNPYGSDLQYWLFIISFAALLLIAAGSVGVLVGTILR